VCDAAGNAEQRARGASPAACHGREPGAAGIRAARIACVQRALADVRVERAPEQPLRSRGRRGRDNLHRVVAVRGSSLQPAALAASPHCLCAVHRNNTEAHRTFRGEGGVQRAWDGSYQRRACEGPRGSRRRRGVGQRA
jgi:hypothetical protein